MDLNRIYNWYNMLLFLYQSLMIVPVKVISSSPLLLSMLVPRGLDIYFFFRINFWGLISDREKKKKHKKTKMRYRSKSRSERCILLSSTAVEAENEINHGKVSVSVKLCVDALNRLKSLGLSSLEVVKLFDSISKLERLRRHVSRTIRETARSLFNSWMQIRDDKQGREGSRSLTYEEEEGKTQEASGLTKNKDESCKNEAGKNKVTTEARLEEKKKEFVELFKAAMKSANAANAACMVLNAGGQTSKEEARSLVQNEVLRCVTSLKSLMEFDITPTQPSKMMEKLEGLSKHKFHKIHNEATRLLEHWRQKVIENDRKSRAKMFPKTGSKTPG